MSTYSAELKEQIVKKMMPPNSQTVAAISRETGISAPTLYAWKKPLPAQGHVLPSQPVNPDRWDAQAKLAAGMQTTVLNEAERSTCCRERGLYVEQLDTWKQACEAMDPHNPSASQADVAATRKPVRALEKELRR